MKLVALEGHAKVLVLGEGKMQIYISRDVALDSNWPFERGEKLRARIDTRGKRLIIEKVPSPS